MTAGWPPGLRSLWRRIQADPLVMRRFHGWSCIAVTAWGLAMLPPWSPIHHLADQVAYVTFISHLALSLSLLSAWQSSRVEIKQDEQAPRRDRP